MHLPRFLDSFTGKLSNTSHSIAGVVSLSPYQGGSALKEALERMRFYGLISFIKMSIHIIKNKLLSLIAGGAVLRECYSISNVIKKYGLKGINISSVNSAHFISDLQKQKVDLIISIAAPQIFKQEVLVAPRLGCINYHSALLPRYRGRQPLFWAMLNDEKEVGISIHEMDEKLDNGPIIVQKKIIVDSNDTLHSLYLKTIEIGPDALLEAIKKLEVGDKARLENNPQHAKYYGFPTKEHSQEYRKKGNKFI